MKKSIVIWGAAIIMIALAWYVVKHQGSSSDLSGATKSQETQQSMPSTSVQLQNVTDFTLYDLSGKKVSLSDFKGKYIYLNFWATWCPPCRGELPGIEKIYQQYKDKGLVVLAVDLGEDKESVRNFMEQNNYHFPVLLDSDQKVGTEYNISAIPVSYFIDRDGNVAQKKVGALTEEELNNDINQLMSK